MVAAGVGAIAVVDGERLVGLFTERDLMVRVMAPGLDPARVPVGQVMTAQLHVISASGTHAQAAKLMLEAHCRHLPVMLEGQRVGGILSIRHLYRDQLRRLRNEMSALQGFLSADGPGG
jgi:CBS domain-containing protein